MHRPFFTPSVTEGVRGGLVLPIIEMVLPYTHNLALFVKGNSFMNLALFAKTILIVARDDDDDDD